MVVRDRITEHNLTVEKSLVIYFKTEYSISFFTSTQTLISNIYKKYATILLTKKALLKETEADYEHR